VVVWLKVTGAALVMAAGAVLGLNASRQYRLRPRQLDQFSRAVELLATEIAYALMPLPEALQQAARVGGLPVAAVFAHAAALLAAGEASNADEGWRRALAMHGPALALNVDDLGILEGLGAVFALPSAREQRHHLELTVRRLAHQEQVARREEVRYAGLAVQLGVLGALALTIVLL